MTDSVVLRNLGWDASWQAAHDAVCRSSSRSQPGRVVRADRGACTLITDTGEARAAYAPALDPLPWVGDWVTCDIDTGVVLAVLPRRGALRRADSAPGSSREQVLACNVDIGVVAEPVWPGVDVGRIERLVTLTWDGGATPVVALTKVDLLASGAATPPGEPVVAAVHAQVAASAPGCEVLLVSATTGAGLDPLRAMLRPGVTVAFLGPSGAGKSTLVNALAGRNAAATGEVRRDGKGRHTTAHRELVVTDSGACVLDTPGLRAVGLVGSVSAADAGGLARAFPEVDALLARCRFADCAHGAEPDCAVRAALDSGELDQRRWQSWLRLSREAQWAAARTDKRLAAERRNRWKALHREARERSRR